MVGLYVHVPFCVRKCLYCDFFVVPLGKGAIAERLKVLPESRQPRYLDALAAEFRLLPQFTEPPDMLPPVRTVYIGGGTPTELSLADFTRLFDELRFVFDLTAVEEFTVEANPGTLTRGHAELMFERGVNRISLGVQSFDDETLDKLGRIHTAEEARETVTMLREVGFQNLNLDLIINLPDTTLAQVDWDVENLLACEPEHASCYALDWTPGTHFSILKDSGLMQEVDEEIAVAQYHHLRRKLLGAGFHHYELFNFAKSSFEAKHNLDTWRGGDLLGFGPSASSHVQGVRCTNVASLPLYQGKLLAGESPVTERDPLSAERKARELLMTALRQMDGVPRDWFAGVSGFEIETLAGGALAEFAEAGWIYQDAERVRITPEGVYVSNRIFEAIL